MSLASGLTVPFGMDRTEAARKAALVALPFLLLPAGIWLGATAAEQLPVLDWWWVVRWTLRAVYVGGAILGWRLGRPCWFYPWFGFAVYEAVATLLGAGQYALAFAPYLSALLWVGGQRSQRILAAYTVFPHAALTLPLALYIDYGPMLREVWEGTLLSAAAAAVFAVVFWQLSLVVPHSIRNWARASVLYGGVLVCQLFNLVEVEVDVPGSPLVTPSMPFSLAVVGWVILSGPFLMPPLVQLVGVILRIEQTSAWIQEQRKRP